MLSRTATQRRYYSKRVEYNKEYPKVKAEAWSTNKVEDQYTVDDLKEMIHYLKGREEKYKRKIHKVPKDEFDSKIVNKLSISDEEKVK